MTTKVFSFKAIISNDSARLCLEEIARGMRYYNSMIHELNKRVQAEIECVEEAAYGLLGETVIAKEAVAKLIYRCIKRHSRDIRAQFPASGTECYTGTYHAVQAAFDQTMSSKRKGVWPGDKYRMRYPEDSSGAAVGVHIQGGATTWGMLKTGRTSICLVDREMHADKRGTVKRWATMRLKVAKDATVDVRVRLLARGTNQRSIPDDAIVSHVLLCRVNDWGNSPVDKFGKPRGKWVLRVTAKCPANDLVIGTDHTSREPISVSVGWSMREDGTMIVAVCSDGTELAIPAYAMRMAERNNELRAERDQLANTVKEYLPLREGERAPKSCIGVSNYIERHGLHCRADVKLELSELFGKLVNKEHELRAVNDHVRRRFLDIRTDCYRKFVHGLQGKQVYIEKINIKALAEHRSEKEDTGATSRFLASTHLLLTMLTNSGAEMVPSLGDARERLGDEREPTLANAHEILVSALEGKRFQTAARKQVRKYRRSKKSSGTPLNAQTMAS